MELIDLGTLVTQIQTAATAAIGKDVTALSGFSSQQLTAIAQQAVVVSAGIADGSITGETREFFLDSLKEMVRSFVNTLAGLVTVVIEQTWNAIVGVIWDAIGKAAGLALKCSNRLNHLELTPASAFARHRPRRRSGCRRRRRV